MGLRKVVGGYSWYDTYGNLPDCLDLGPGSLDGGFYAAL